MIYCILGGKNAGNKKSRNCKHADYRRESTAFFKIPESMTEHLSKHHLPLHLHFRLILPQGLHVFSEEGKIRL